MEATCERLELENERLKEDLEAGESEGFLSLSVADPKDPVLGFRGVGRVGKDVFGTWDRTGISLVTGVDFTTALAWVEASRSLKSPMLQ